MLVVGDEKVLTGSDEIIQHLRSEVCLPPKFLCYASRKSLKKGFATGRDMIWIPPWGNRIEQKFSRFLPWWKASFLAPWYVFFLAFKSTLFVEALHLLDTEVPGCAAALRLVDGGRQLLSSDQADLRGIGIISWQPFASLEY